MERRGWATRVEIGFVNWQQEEPTGFDRKGGTSRIRREAYVRFCEGLGVKIPGPPRHLETEETVRYSDTDKPKGSETQLRLNLIPPRQISTLPPILQGLRGEYFPPAIVRRGRTLAQDAIGADTISIRLHYPIRKRRQWTSSEPQSPGCPLCVNRRY